MVEVALIALQFIIVPVFILVMCVLFISVRDFLVGRDS